jgi:hypothetical protein
MSFRLARLDRLGYALAAVLAVLDADLQALAHGRSVLGDRTQDGMVKAARELSDTIGTEVSVVIEHLQVRA